jgi:thiaminase/transcriptional activator TenA
MADTWSDEAWSAIQGIFREITVHAFVTGLIDGGLEREKFLFYLNQDALYLDDFGKVLAGIAAKCSDRSHTEDFLGFAKDTITVERALHREYLGQIDAGAKASPACLLYTSYMQRQMLLAPLEVIVATVLPCFWIYQEVGDFILAQKPGDDNPYKKWIDTYGGEEYGQAVKRAVAIADELAAAATPATRERMTEAFVLCSKMEWMFWDSAWRLEQWPL